MKAYSFLTALLFTVAAFSQQGKTIRITSPYAMFPDTARANGHDYNGIHFDVMTHYSDSSVLIYVPTNFSAKEKISFVIWFHGWGNNIDSACKQYQLLEQMEASGRNAIFIFPEGPKNASDSYGGKLEQPQIFRQLIQQVVTTLADKKIIKAKKTFTINDYNIALAGHSGAYRVISKIINYSPVNEVILFDAMYGGNDAYLQWLAASGKNRFINIYTQNGGTFDNSHFIMDKLRDSLHVTYISVNEDAVNENLLRANQKIFIFSSKAHNEVITNNNNWERFLKYKPKLP